jgi:quercetin dioxygenase-like cupin family protein
MITGYVAFRKVALTAALIGACYSTAEVRAQAAAQPTAVRPAVIKAEEGEKRFLRGGAAPLWIKVDPVTTGSTRMVLGRSDLPPGDAIAVHRHLQEDEIMIITRGTARVQLGTRFYTAAAGDAVFIPQGTCIALTNIGVDTLSNFFVFSSPGFERSMREVSSPAGAPFKSVSPAQRAAAFQLGHAEAAPPRC